LGSAFLFLSNSCASTNLTSKWIGLLAVGPSKGGGVQLKPKSQCLGFAFFVFEQLLCKHKLSKTKKPSIYRLKALVVGVAVKSSNFFEGGFGVV